MTQATAAADYRLEGAVSFETMARIRAAGEAAIDEAGERAVVDLSGLESGNSVTVALLMAWLRAAERAGKTLVITAAPVELINIVELSGMTSVLPLAEAS